MTWAYCDRCQGALPFPKISDAIIGQQECECGEVRNLSELERRSVIDSFADLVMQPARQSSGPKDYPRDLTRPQQGN